MASVSPDLCCCCSLKTGGTVIGVLDIIGGVVIIIYSVVFLGAGTILQTAHQNKASDDTSWKNSDSKDLAFASTLLYTLSAIFLIVGVCAIVLGIILLRGIKKESGYLLKIWIIFRVVLLILGTVCGLAKYFIKFNPFDLGQDIFALMISVWFITVIYYLRKEFQDRASYMAPVAFKS